MSTMLGITLSQAKILANLTDITNYIYISARRFIMKLFYFNSGEFLT
jgi:hypothetical protein